MTVRERNLIEIEIAAARWAFLAADEAGDYDEADRQYQRMDRLLEQLIPTQRQP